MPFNMFDVVRYGNAKQGPGTGLKIAVPSKTKRFAKISPSCVHSTGQALKSLSMCLWRGPRFWEGELSPLP